MIPLSDIKFACLDTETTGLSPERGGKICEIAVSVSQNGRKLEEFSTLRAEIYRCAAASAGFAGRLRAGGA